jgi:hypothetical protein
MKKYLLLLITCLLSVGEAYADAKQNTYPDLGTFNPATDRLIGLRNNNTNAKFMAGVGTVSGLQPCTTDGTKAAANNTLLQAALTAGGEVFIPVAGTYCNSATLQIGSNTHFWAVQGTKIINIAGVNGPVLTNLTHSAPGDTNISIENIFFDGNKVGNASAAFATVWMYYGDHYFFNNDRFDGGVRLVSFPNGTFGEGLRLHNVTNSFVSNSDAQNNLYDGFKINGGSGNVFVNLHAANNGRCGVQLTYDNYNNGGTLLPTPTALTMTYRNTIIGVAVENTSATPSSVAPDTCGIYLHGASYTAISGLTAKNVNMAFGYGDSSSYNSVSSVNADVVYDGSHAFIAIEPPDSGFAANYNVMSDITLHATSGANPILYKTFTDSQNNSLADVTYDMGGATGSPSVSIAGTNNRIRNVKSSAAITLSDTGTSTDIFDMNSGVGITAQNGALNGAAQTVSISGSAFTIPAATGNAFTVTLNGATITANAPTSPKDGQRITLTLIQDATGSRAVTWNGAFSFPGGTPPTLTTTATKADVLQFVYNSTLGKWLYTGGTFGF